MNTMLLIGMPGGSELLIILLVVLLLFGGSKLPQLAKALGQSKRAFKDGLDESEREAQPEVKEKKV
jgi:sec-independent protein translocase protein TatA